MTDHGLTAIDGKVLAAAYLVYAEYGSHPSTAITISHLVERSGLDKEQVESTLTRHARDQFGHVEHGFAPEGRPVIFVREPLYTVEDLERIFG